MAQHALFRVSPPPARSARGNGLHRFGQQKFSGLNPALELFRHLEGHGIGSQGRSFHPLSLNLDVSGTQLLITDMPDYPADAVGVITPVILDGQQDIRVGKRR